uniref:Uncharacterized protein n=1 Tax=Rhizophora mucronata TaxID=61149 RepID=A0A2P2K2F0_RHIMU
MATDLCFVLCYCRKLVAKLLEQNHKHLYRANKTWLTSVRRHLRGSLIDGVKEAFKKSKPLSFLSHTVPECSCVRHDLPEIARNASATSNQSQVDAPLRVVHRCPAWMDGKISLTSKDKEVEEDLDEDLSSSSGFFRHSSGNHETEVGEINKEEAHLDDPEDLEGADK